MNITYPNMTNSQINIESFEHGLNTSKDKNLTNFSYALSVENFSFKDGALKNGIGFMPLVDVLDPTNTSFKADLESIGSIERVFHFYKYNSEEGKREDKLIFVNHLNKIYYINLFDETKELKSLRSVSFTTPPLAVRYRLNGDDVIILSSETDNMVVWDGTNEPFTVLDAPRISSMALHYERLFATVDGEKNAVWFSDDLDPTNWSVSLDEAGFIELIDERGALLKVVSFLDYIYIFREYGISRLSAYSEQTSFSISNLFVSSGKIYASSVCVCGDRIIFLAEDGLYSFDGVSTTKILSSIENNLSGLNNNNASACYYNGYYFLSCKFKFVSHEDNCLEDFVSNALLCIDLSETKLVSITHGVNIINLYTIEALGGVVALAVDDEKNAFLPTFLCNNAQFIDKKLEKVWISPTSKLGAGYNKIVLRKIYIESEGDLTLTIFDDKNKREILIKGKNKPQAIRVNIPLYNFSFKINTSDSTCNIKNLSFEFAKSKAIF